MEYRSAEVRQRLEKVGRETSMLHMDVLLLIHHFARFAAGSVLEIGPYIGGSTIAAAFGARESGTQKKIITIEAGGSLKHFRLSSRNIIKDLKKNLARFGVAEDVTLINGRSSDEAIISEVRQCLSSREISLFIFDAGNDVRRDSDCYGDLLNDGCWVVIDDYFGPAKAAPLRAQVDALVGGRRLVPFGYYGWGTWVGQWQRSWLRLSRGGRSVSVARLEITLCSPGQKALTTSRFIWKVNTHFYHARTATCSIRAYKQRVDYPSIPDRGGSPRLFLAPYDHSTSSGSSTGYPESATSD